MIVNDTKILAVRLPTELHKQLKLASVELNISIQEIIVNLVSMYLEPDHVK
jgi:predicted HicB family RNase H-like nuclease